MNNEPIIENRMIAPHNAEQQRATNEQIYKRMLEREAEQAKEENAAPTTTIDNIKQQITLLKQI